MIDIAERRAGFDSLGNNVTFANGVGLETATIAGVECHWLRPGDGTNSDVALIYIHGGAFTLGSIKSHGPWVSHLTGALAMDTLFIEYRRAPEAPYPQAIEDIIEVVNALLEDNPGTNVALAADSAGGGLAISVLPSLMKSWAGRILANVLVSPFIDLTCSLPSYDTQASLDPKLSRDSLKEHVRLYVGESTLDEANPASRLGEQFPPTLILVGTDEVLLDDSKLGYERIGKRQSRCELAIFEGSTHVWVMDDITSDASVQTLSQITTFINDILTQEG